MDDPANYLITVAPKEDAFILFRLSSAAIDGVMMPPMCEDVWGLYPMGLVT